MNATPAKIFVVDDDPSVRKALVRLFRSVGLEPEAFGSAGEFLAQGCSDAPSCLVLDVSMPAVTGPDLQRQLRQAGNGIPVIFLTGHGDVPITASAMKLGAVDVLTKPANEEDLLKAVHRAIAADQAARVEREAVASLRQRLLRLTPREREVLGLVVVGRLNKQIAAELGMSQRTVKVHRGRVMRKMQVSSVAELVRITDRLGIAPPCSQPRTASAAGSSHVATVGHAAGALAGGVPA